ncbi:hypothetical protein [Nostoc sp.]
MVRLDLWAEIIPRVSAAGFSIGQHLSSIPDLSEPNLVIAQKEEIKKYSTISCGVGDTKSRSPRRARLRRERSVERCPPHKIG